MPNIRLSDEVYEILVKCQGLLMYRDSQSYSFNDVVSYLLANTPEIELPLGNGLRVELNEQKEEQSNERRD